MRLIPVGISTKTENTLEGNLKLENRYSSSRLEEYRCDLTKELDNVSGISKVHNYDMFHHYILADKWCKKERCLAIRVPGGTVGGIYFDNNNAITQIVIDTDYVVKTYPSNINELVQKYVGEVIEW